MIPIRDTAPCHNKPWVTWILMAICSGIFLALRIMPFEQSNQLLQYYGMIPARYTNPQWAMQVGLPFDYYFSLVSNLFLHVEWEHLLINLCFLWIFADNVEDRMGRVRFLIFYLICGILASFLQWHFDPTLNIPVIGASGAIAGVIAAYFFLYPMERVILWIPPVFLFPVPAIMFLGLWLILQLYHATTAMVFNGGGMEVAWWAHLGGFTAGSVLYRLFIKKITP